MRLGRLVLVVCFVLFQFLFTFVLASWLADSRRKHERDMLAVVEQTLQFSEKYRAQWRETGDWPEPGAWSAASFEFRSSRTQQVLGGYARVDDYVLGEYQKLKLEIELHDDGEIRVWPWFTYE